MRVGDCLHSCVDARPMRTPQAGTNYTRHNRRSPHNVPSSVANSWAAHRQRCERLRSERVEADHVEIVADEKHYDT